MNVHSYRAMFDEIDRGYETIWVHKTAPIWVVHYEAIEGSRDFRREFWQPYRAIEKVKRGAKVWSANNKRIGQEGEFTSLDAALAAADQYAKQLEAA